MRSWREQQVIDLHRLDGAWRTIVERSAEIEAEVVDGWRNEALMLMRLEHELRAAGRWVSGPRDLMGVLEVEFDEVRHCRVLRWLLDPSGGHGMGPGFLREFASDVSRRSSIALDVDQMVGVAVAAEETRSATRADIVLRTASWTMLVEAKIFAAEQPSQGERLESLWADEEPVLVFLTRSGARMKTGSDQWIPYTWREVAECLRRLLSGADGQGSGAVREYLKTLEAHLR